MASKKISVIGLGKLGACYAAFYASKGYRIIGFDVNKQHVEAIDSGMAPVKEPGLAELIQKNKSRIEATTDLSRITKESDITFIIVPTPSKENGLFSVDYIISVAKAIGPHLKNKKNHHTFVLVSTVLPGDSRTYIIPAFEKYSGKKCGEDFGYVYSPSLIAIGDILRNLEYPDFLFLGAYDEVSKKKMFDIYKNIYQENQIKPMSIESAELAKISLNSYVTMKITFANVLGEICSNIQHADVDEVTRALGEDKRIGSPYLKSGLGYGGPCFPRDNFAFAGMAKKLGIKAPLALATHNLNNAVWKKTVSLIMKLPVPKNTVIGVLGISYKPNTTLSEESQSLLITKTLIKNKRRVIVHEPLGHHEAEKILKDKVIYSRELSEILNKSRIIFISNPDKSFSILPSLISRVKTKKIIVDPWGMFTKKDFPENISYISLGRKR